MANQPRNYDEELSQLIEKTRQHCQGLSIPVVPPVQDDTSHTPTLTWVADSSGEHKGMRNANS